MHDKTSGVVGGDGCRKAKGRQEGEEALEQNRQIKLGLGLAGWSRDCRVPWPLPLSSYGHLIQFIIYATRVTRSQHAAVAFRTPALSPDLCHSRAGRVRLGLY